MSLNNFDKISYTELHTVGQIKFRESETKLAGNGLGTGDALKTAMGLDQLCKICEVFDCIMVLFVYSNVH